MGAGTVLITGASSGIGEALARKFAAEGFALIITARRRERLQALADELGGDITVVDADLGVPGGAAALIEAIADRDVSVLVNNAGVARTGDFLSQDIADIDAMLALNISALTTLTRHYAEQMAKRGVGRILNVASVAAFQPVPGMSLYAATKAFVLSLSEGLSEEFRDRGVYVTALCPGLTRTDMVSDVAALGVPEVAMSTPEDVARQGYDALMAREVIRIPGLLNAAAVTWLKHQPRWLVRGLGGLFGRATQRR